MRKIIFAMLLLVLCIGFGINANASSYKGMSVNMVKTYHYLNKDKIEKIYFKNDNNYTMGVELQPQKKINGHWKNLDWFDYEFVNSHKKVSTIHYLKNHFDNKAGTYRYKVTSYTFDKKHNEHKAGMFYTRQFYIKK